MYTVCHPESGRLKVFFGPVAAHYRVGIDICPARHAWRMLALALARAAVDAGHRVYFTTAADLAKRCRKAAIEGR